MDSYVTEDQQVEAIRKWWKENGISVIMGVVLGLAIVFAVRTWSEWRANKSEAAAAIYHQIDAGLKKAQPVVIEHAGTRLIDEFPNSVYAIFGALAQAAVMVEKGDLAGARGRLEWAVMQASDPYIKAIAELRLGYLLLDQGDTARALTLGENSALLGFRAEANELRGDILHNQGDMPGAKKAYQAALTLIPSSSAMAANLHLKIDDLGGEI